MGGTMGVRVIFSDPHGQFLLLLLLTCTPDLDVCTNHEVVMFQPWTGTFPDLSSITIVNLINILLGPTCFNRVQLLPYPHFTPFDATPLSLLHPILPPNYPDRGASVHVGIDPTHQPPPLVPALNSLAVFDLLPISLPAP